ncbi:MAG TPA: hypothetical protein VMI94_19000 [Bryobacteraceae bacterium]|nr:hypothetical protein [Bryobacteraceae bacterium]
MTGRVLVILGGILLITGCLTEPARAQESTANPEIEKLKAQLAAQQQQIDQLRKAMEDEKKVLEEASQPKLPSLGQVASGTPVVPAGEAEPILHPGLAAALSPQQANEPPASPLQIHLGTITITPVGFMDMTGVFRSTNPGTSIGTNFGSIPYGGTPQGQLTEMRFSAQNSRIGARIDGTVHGARILAYWESDFLGTTPGNFTVTSNSNTFRMRLYWIDVRKDKWEILGGQSWSLMTPGRNGISGLPGDVFYSQDFDTNYQLGLTWSRQPGFRFVYHPTKTIAWGLALEEAEQYGGGSGGGGTIVLPSSLASSYANLINTGSQGSSDPSVGPDIITKLAFDPVASGKHMHIELVGLLSTFKTYNQLSSQSFTKTGGGGEFNVNLEMVKGFHLIGNTFFSDGGGRYIFGLAPDLIVRPDGSPSLVHSYSTVDGFEYHMKNAVLYAYYGGVDIGRNFSLDPANKNAYVGYGFPGSSTGQDRIIQEASFGINPTFWKSPNYGALGMFIQYSYLTRSPWAPTATARNASSNMIWVDLRYTLPGQPPAASK